MTIRTATAEDAAAIAAIWNAMIRDTLATFTTVEKTQADIEDLIATRQGAFWVSTDEDGTPSGFATYGPFRPGPGYAATVEHTVVMAPDHHGRGIGHLLMNAAEEHARAQGCHVMVAGISSANTAAQSFHANRGYAETGRLAQVGRKNDRWLDLILMQKTVSAP